MKYDLIHVTPLNPVIGAEIHGVDLSKPVGAATFKEIEAALHQHLVIFFRDQDLGPDAHMAFAAQFGELEPPHPLFPKIDNRFAQGNLLEQTIKKEEIRSDLTSACSQKQTLGLVPNFE